MQATVTKGCERLVHPSVTTAESRLYHRRLLGLLFSGPFFMACVAALFLPPLLGGALAVGAISAILASGWLAGIVVSATGKTDLAASGAVLAAVVATAGLIAAAGGAGSPAALCVVALVLEPFWLGRSRRSLLIGIGGVGIALLAQFWFARLGVAEGAPPIWHWLLPMAYAGTLYMRLPVPLANSSKDVSAGAGVEEILDAVVLHIGEANEVVQVSERAGAVLGLRPDLLLGQGLFERIHVADRVAYLCALASLRDGGGKQKTELRIRLPHNTAADNFRPFVLDAVASGDEHGRIIVAVLRSDDETNALRQRLEDALQKVDSVDLTKDRFLAAVSHELRTPLNAIIGFSDILLHEMYGQLQDPRQKEYVGLIREAGHHLLSVVNTILDVSKIESGSYITHPEQFDFRDAVQMCRSMLAVQAAAKGLSLVDEVAATTGQITADRRAIQQMLINLVANAIKFTPEGGQVAIGAKRIGSRLHFRVADTGIGISEADLDKIGRPFVQVQNDYTRRYEGTGLGLALVKGMVMLHDGEMSIESAPGEGTTVFINLPADGASQAPRTGELLPMPLPAKREEAHGTLRKTA